MDWPPKNNNITKTSFEGLFETADHSKDGHHMTSMKKNLSVSGGKKQKNRKSAGKLTEQYCSQPPGVVLETQRVCVANEWGKHLCFFYLVVLLEQYAKTFFSPIFNHLANKLERWGRGSGSEANSCRGLWGWPAHFLTSAGFLKKKKKSTKR